MDFDAIANAVAGPFAAACLLLAFAGATKITRPGATAVALRALRLPSTRPAVRALGVAECAVALAGLMFGGVAAAAVAVMYVALGLVALRLLVRAPGTACGCLGASDAPVGITHVVVDACAAVAAVLAVGAGSPVGVLAGDPWLRVAYVLLVGCATWLGTLLLGTVVTATSHTTPTTPTRGGGAA